MAYGESKVYFDGSHYIAIPHTTRPTRRRARIPEEQVEVKDANADAEKESTLTDTEGVPFEQENVKLEEVNLDEIEEFRSCSQTPSRRSKSVGKRARSCLRNGIWNV